MQLSLLGLSERVNLSQMLVITTLLLLFSMFDLEQYLTQPHGPHGLGCWAEIDIFNNSFIWIRQILVFHSFRLEVSYAWCHLRDFLIVNAFGRLQCNVAYYFSIKDDT